MRLPNILNSHSLMLMVSILNFLSAGAGLIILFYLQQTTVRLKKWRYTKHRIWPKISIIVPIHNEQQYLKSALTSLCLLDYDNYEIIAVDDRSNDSSASIIEELTLTYSHLSHIAIKKLPANWLGKTHALQQGLIAAHGEYVVFTDADVTFRPLLLRKAIDYMLSEQLGHLTLIPKIQVTRFSMKCFMPFLLYIMLLAIRPWQFKNYRTKHAVGIGAFNCVHREQLIACGGMHKLALNPIDDIGLGQLIKRRHIKQKIANPEDLLTLTWYEHINQCVNGFEKNIFAFFDYSLIKSFCVLLLFLNFIFIPWIAIFFFNSIGFLLPMLAIVCVVLSLILSCTQLALAKSYALAYPFAAAVTLFIGIRSVVLSILRQGIYWGGVFFPLKKLIFFKNKN